MVVWITGLPGSGKSFFSRKLRSSLSERGLASVELDGDQLRESLEPVIDENYSVSGRERLSQVYANLAKCLSDQGQIVLVPTVSLFERTRTMNRALQGSYLEIFLNPAIEVLIERDKKNIYSKNRIHRFADLTRIGINPDFPTQSDFEFCDFGDQEIQLVAEKIIKLREGIEDKQ